ncbi:MAG: hypothetical protein Q8L07_01160 [Sediminibacterium sp.]|nr:hypothetical protein [Sediminibacterium sp.]MDP1811156.1 hypothetical protein [Sediminibacterium sp.]MDP3128656.1 hypothetical protein [Sediminibacterium sp.]MDP3667713.1 hypothetical protein [Sediminibacterium sp.]
MRYLVQILITLYCTSTSLAQYNGEIFNDKGPSHAMMTATNSWLFENIRPGINGSPYFMDDYKYADIKLKKGRSFVGVRAKINLYSQDILFLSSNGFEGLIEMGMVNEISFSDTTTEGVIPYKFQTGFPAIDRQNGNHFYLILAEGRCSFIKSIIKIVSERKNDLLDEKNKDYETRENYYLFINGNMKKWKKDTNFFLSELSDRQTEVNQFILSNKINGKNAEQVIKLLKYYNSL